MNGQYYKNPKFPTLEEDTELMVNNNQDGDIHDISLATLLLSNKGLAIKGYFLSNDELKTYEGLLEQVGDNFIVINSNNSRIILLLSNVDHIEFKDAIKYKNVLEYF